MKRIESYRDLVVWQQAMELVISCPGRTRNATRNLSATRVPNDYPTPTTKWDVCYTGSAKVFGRDHVRLIEDTRW
jgi:hypothetical protein